MLGFNTRLKNQSSLVERIGEIQSAYISGKRSLVRVCKSDKTMEAPHKSAFPFKDRFLCLPSHLASAREWEYWQCNRPSWPIRVKISGLLSPVLPTFEAVVFGSLLRLILVMQRPAARTQRQNAATRSDQPARPAIAFSRRSIKRL